MPHPRVDSGLQTPCVSARRQHRGEKREEVLDPLVVVVIVKPLPSREMSMPSCDTLKTVAVSALASMEYPTNDTIAPIVSVTVEPKRQFAGPENGTTLAITASSISGQTRERGGVDGHGPRRWFARIVSGRDTIIRAAASRMRETVDDVSLRRGAQSRRKQHVLLTAPTQKTPVRGRTTPAP